MFTDLSDPTTQIADFNPGIAKNGFFWTIPIPADAVHFNLGRKHARLCLSDVLASDMGNLGNAIAGGLSFPASVCFDVKWRASGRQQRLVDDANDFEYRFFESEATVEWQGQRLGRTYVSDAGDTSVHHFAAIGFETNGDLR